MIKRVLIPTLLLSSSVAVAAPLSDDQASQDLLDLRDELVNVGQQAALDDLPRYRPLCDAVGYPLVGNVLPKDGGDMSTMPEIFQPSDLCGEVREGQS